MESVVEASDVVFAALPHGLSEELAVNCDKNGKVLIDLGADFRLTEESAYTKWYGLPFKYPALQKSALLSAGDQPRKHSAYQYHRQPRLLSDEHCAWPYAGFKRETL